ncbi:uncharacterized protein At1g51745-like [Apium graveolens]|uniref:uncharacterized protein At1g51745-like n=1 Tax=Apium graveolens TaxID=4045 RepID=UPI003D793A5F
MSGSGENKTKGVDEFPNGLVWVRRRNGSWWPGRVLGPDELPEGCLTTPRSGTPVKLLGREDASVDWYNLGKSIRIKAFRCGEYDRCIERAKASADGSFKKPVKYARREHAILHALEIESAGQSKNQVDICSNVDKPSYEGVDAKESPPTLLPNKETDHMAEELIGSKDKSVLGYELSHSGVSYEEMNTKEQSSQGMRRKTPNDSEDDGTEGIKRMRGLEDLGMRGLEDLGKRKRSIVPSVHEFLKKKNRRRQLKKVLESTAKVMVPVKCEPVFSPTESSLLGVSESKLSGIESIESKGSLSVVINNNSDSTGENGTSFNASENANDSLLIGCKQKESEISSTGQADGDFSNKLFGVSLVGEDLAGLMSGYIPWATRKPQIAAVGQSSQSSQVKIVPLTNAELNESGSTSSGATNVDVIQGKMKEGSSKWMLKGKRNLRTSRSRKQGFEKFVDDGKELKDYMAVLKPGVVGAPLVSTAVQIKSEPVTDTQVDEVRDWGTHILHKKPQMMVRKSELATSQRLLPYRQSRYTMNPKYQSSDFTPRVYAPDSKLFDVNVEVKVSSRPRHVPYISLMSKLTGQPIIGHPLTVEVLKDGACDLLRSSSKCRDDEDICGSEGEDTSYEQKPKQRGRKISSKRLLSEARHSTGKSLKSRKDGGLSKKIRTLSSITGSHEQNVGVKKPVVQTVKGPSLACVPLKVVFSRINAALN